MKLMTAERAIKNYRRLKNRRRSFRGIARRNYWFFVALRIDPTIASSWLCAVRT